MPEETTITSTPIVGSTPVTPTRTTVTTGSKKSFGWGAFLLGCALGGCLIPVIVTIIITVVGATAIKPLLEKYAGPEFQSALQSLKETTPVPTPTLPTAAKDCTGDEACMTAAAKSCTAALSQITQGGFTMLYKIIGPSSKIPGNCQISFEISNVTNETFANLGLTGQSMVCDVKPAVFSTQTDILNASDSDLNCTGSLWGLMQIVRAGQSSQ